jgi:hypothetical protein
MKKRRKAKVERQKRRKAIFFIKVISNITPCKSRLSIATTFKSWMEITLDIRDFSPNLQ